jgi:hypothetical protein
MRVLSVAVALVVVVAAACLAAPRGADGAGECGATPPDTVALRLAPCASAAEDPGSAPSGSCCSAVHAIGKQSPRCLCAVMLSNTARSAGIKAEVAITIPKRCNLADRPVGYKCGGSLQNSFLLLLLLLLFTLSLLAWSACTNH